MVNVSAFAQDKYFYEWLLFLHGNNLTCKVLFFLLLAKSQVKIKMKKKKLLKKFLLLMIKWCSCKLECYNEKMKG